MMDRVFVACVILVNTVVGGVRINQGKRWNEVVDHRWHQPLGADYTVSSAADIAALQDTLEPGDVLVMATGDWMDQEIVLSAIGSSEPGMAIYLVPEVYGEVRMMGESSITFTGQYLEVRGMFFYGESSPKPLETVFFEKESSHCRFTDSVIDTYNDPDYPSEVGKKHYISLWGSYHSVDWCGFEGKVNRGEMLRVRTTNDVNHPPGTQPDSWGHYFGYNYLGPRAPTMVDDGEGIQVGLSQSEYLEVDTMIEHNLFFKYDSEIECISLKASNITARHNTLIESTCSITFRHADNCDVSDNYFFCNDKFGCGGVRIGCGVNHTVLRNYIEGEEFKGGARGAMILYTASLDEPKRRQLENIRIQGNMMVDCRTCIHAGSKAREGGDQHPTDIQYIDNIITGKELDSFLLRDEDQIDPTFEGNVAFNGVVENLEQYFPGIRYEDPMLEWDADWGIYRPTAPGLSFDIMYPPLTFDDVGPSWKEINPDKL